MLLFCYRVVFFGLLQLLLFNFFYSYLYVAVHCGQQRKNFFAQGNLLVSADASQQGGLGLTPGSDAHLSVWSSSLLVSVWVFSVQKSFR